MRKSRATLLVTIAGSLLAHAAVSVSAEQRVALVIGNAQYTHAPRLANPLNDMADW